MLRGYSISEHKEKAPSKKAFIYIETNITVLKMYTLHELSIINRESFLDLLFASCSDHLQTKQMMKCTFATDNLD